MAENADEPLLDRLRQLSGEAWRLGAEARAGRLPAGRSAVRVLLSDLAVLTAALQRRRADLEAEMRGSAERFAASACYRRADSLVGGRRLGAF